MGFDRIRYMSGVDGESTIITADKRSASTVFGSKFGFFMLNQGHRSQLVVDVQQVASNEWVQGLINKKNANVAEFPELARRKWVSGVIATQALEVRPPLTDDVIKVLNSYLVTECDPNDAGLILDNRNGGETVLASY